MENVVASLSSKGSSISASLRDPAQFHDAHRAGQLDRLQPLHRPESIGQPKLFFVSSCTMKIMYCGASIRPLSGSAGSVEVHSFWKRTPTYRWRLTAMVRAELSAASIMLTAPPSDWNDFTSDTHGRHREAHHQGDRRDDQRHLDQRQTDCPACSAVHGFRSFILVCRCLPLLLMSSAVPNCLSGPAEISSGNVSPLPSTNHST